MIKNYPYLKDKDFLIEIDESLVTTQYAQIILLDWNENPIQNIEGKIIGGNLSIQGDSSVRRTGTLDTFVEDDSYDYYSLNSLFSLNKKIFLEIGIKNTTQKYQDYPIIWFPQGYFLITGLSLQHSLTGTTINLSLKDKMALLNGDCGGTIPAAVTFNEKDDYAEEREEVELTKVTIYQIIYELVNHFGEIPISKILINDVPLQIRQVMKWIGDTPLYQYIQMKDGKESYTYDIKTHPEISSSPMKTFQYGDDVGYIYTDFVFPDELVSEPGQSVCDILDKIKNVLGNYEYFFDIWGNFVFQEKKNYLNTRQNTIQLQLLKNENYLIQMKEGLSVYKFKNSKLIQSISNTPKYENIKNDFIVWGVKKTTDGTEWPIRYHLAIDEKPPLRNKPVTLYLYDDKYGTPKANIKQIAGSTKKEITVADWRTELYIQGLENPSIVTPYYLELDNEWRKMYDLEKQDFKPEFIERPYELDYFLDFIDTDSKLGEYSIQNIGRRTLVLNDKSINCLFEPEIPNVVFINGSEDKEKAEQDRNNYYAKGENWTQVSGEVYNHLAIGGSLNSAFVAVRDLLYQRTNYNEQIQISLVPIFHLEPNTRITVVDDESSTSGDFIINSITIPLDVGAMMSINATKALEKI